MANTNLHFRTATHDDAAQLQQLVQAAFRAEDSRQRWTADMNLSARFRIEVEEISAFLSKPDRAILMATNDNGVLVASIEMSKRDDDLSRLSMLAVDQHQQRGGIGRQILTEAEKYCVRTWGVKKLGLNALSTREELISWYMRCGYEKSGELTPFPHDRIEGITLPADLCFVELEKDSKTVVV